MNQYPYGVCVIGGGSVAVSFLHHLVEHLEHMRQEAVRGLRILILEPRGNVGRGSAYGDDFHSNLLNVTVGAMSVAGDDRGHFRRWLQERGSITTFRGAAIHDDSFVSRPLFGSYLESVYARTVERATRLGVAVEHVPKAADAVRRHCDGHYTVTTSDHQTYTVRHLVLSIGNLESASFREFQAAPRYFPSPYPTTELCRNVAPGAPVCILGTSLSAVDAILALVSQGHSGSILAVSRNGRLPSVRGIRNGPIALRPEFTAILRRRKEQGGTMSLDSLIDLVASELRVCLAGGPSEDLTAIVKSVPHAFEFLDREIDTARAKPRQWQAFGNALNDVIDVLWHLLTPDDRHRFNRDFRTIWMSRRVSFPLENAVALRELMNAGQLRVTGGLESVKFDKQTSQFEIKLNHRRPGSAGGVHSEVLLATHLVNATSFSCDVEQSGMPLLRSLLEQGMAVADPLGGLRIDFDTGGLVSRDGVVERGFTVLGSMASGAYFWTNSMDVNARLALGQARRLAAMLAAPSSRAASSPVITERVALSAAGAVRQRGG